MSKLLVAAPRIPWIYPWGVSKHRTLRHKKDHRFSILETDDLFVLIIVLS
jgi:hypothetical protein